MRTMTEEQRRIAENLGQVRAKIAAALVSAGRPDDAARLIAVSKSHDESAVRAALAAGQREFGENRVQEAQRKFPPLKREFPDLVLHLIGPLQTNKVADAVALFDVIHSVDREKLARALAEETARQNRRPSCLIQVNTGEEPQKAGVAPGEADALIALARDELRLPVVGLMCIPPPQEEPSLHFALLREIARRNNLSELSMGMSGDFEIAAAFGATMLRVGTAIFGARAV
jgi:pyridoxal phosphate enzyme (YggS family)